MTEMPDQLRLLKEQAKRLRDKFAASGEPLGHSQALELIALHYGYKDWNTLSATLRKQGFPYEKGDRVSGFYRSHPFTATLLEVTAEKPGWYRLRLALDEAIDVIASPRLSSWRKQIRAVVNYEGVSEAVTSDGVPHLRLSIPG